MACIKIKLDHRTYWTVDKAQHYVEDIGNRIFKMAKQVEAQLKSLLFDGCDPVNQYVKFFSVLLDGLQ